MDQDSKSSNNSELDKPDYYFEMSRETKYTFRVLMGMCSFVIAVFIFGLDVKFLDMEVKAKQILPAFAEFVFLAVLIYSAIAFLLYYKDIRRIKILGFNKLVSSKLSENEKLKAATERLKSLEAMIQAGEKRRGKTMWNLYNKAYPKKSWAFKDHKGNILIETLRKEIEKERTRYIRMESNEKVEAARLARDEKGVPLISKNREFDIRWNFYANGAILAVMVLASLYSVADKYFEVGKSAALLYIFYAISVAVVLWLVKANWLFFRRQASKLFEAYFTRVPRFYLTMKSGANACGIIYKGSNRFLVFKGARFRKKPKDPSANGILGKLEKLNILKEDKNNEKFYRLTKDHIFDSPSSAARLITGNATNGRIAWKTKDGKRLDDIYP